MTAPTLVFNGNDDFHPAFAAEALHEAILSSRLLPCAWTRDDWMLRYVGRIPESVVELYPRMSEVIIDYIREISAAGTLAVAISPVLTSGSRSRPRWLMALAVCNAAEMPGAFDAGIG